jgi:putative CocE/NonD family hydrolase
MNRVAFAVALAALIASSAHAQPAAPLGSDIPPNFVPPSEAADYVKRVVMIPMRDGVKLYTVIVVPKGGVHAPILLTRTPYNARKRMERTHSPHAVDIVSQSDEPFVADGYIRVFQDIRGKYGSEGDYVMTRPLIGPLNATKVDESTDAFDTIDWLVKNVPETNGKVGMIGSSYEGFTVVMALIHPHPALKAAVPESPMVDGWMGDDWFHDGAFRQTNFDYFTGQTTERGEGAPVPRPRYDDYQTFLEAGSAGDYAKAYGLDQLPWWTRTAQHPAYDDFWRLQALDKTLAGQPTTVPVMYEFGAWDQEDIYGAPHAYAASLANDPHGDLTHLVIGPWRHSGANYDGRSLGMLKFEGDTALQWRRDIMKPFLDQYLKDGAPKADTPPVFVYDTGTDKWLREPRWPMSCANGCASPSRKLYLQSGFGLSFEAPFKATAGADDYVSDPQKPVPFIPRPVSFSDRPAWQAWLTTDQRAVADRPDVLSYETDVLTAPVTIEGAPVVNLYAATTGTDADWVVKLIDVYPDAVGSRPEMSGYQLMISADILRGRYRQGFDKPAPLAAGKSLFYRFELPNAAHTFLPGHRIMVQIQSTWFPLYDRNPQKFVDNIFFAKPADYQKATVKVFYGGAQASFVDLPVVSGAGR